MKTRSFLPLLLLAVSLICTKPALSAASPRVAVFLEPGFPFYMASTMISPKAIATNLNAAGVPADLLDVAALSNPARFNAKTYGALVLPYGNTYPADALANMIAFHRAGGCLILSSVPFTHGAALLSAEHWSASPSWSQAVRVVSMAHTGKAAIQLTGPQSDWVGVSSDRHPVQSGQSITVAGWVQDVRGADAGDDWIYIRFYNAVGTYLNQDGAKITSGEAWHQATATVTAPPSAAAFDIAPQVRSAGRVVRLDDLAVNINGRAVNLANAGFETMGDDWIDLGHNSQTARFGPDGIGVGGFVDMPGTGPVRLAPADPLGLQTLKRDWSQGGPLQAIDVASLPSDVEVQPILLQGDQPVAALLIHHSGDFKGAVDVWTHHASTGDMDAYDTQQMLVRGAIAALAVKGGLSPQRKATVFAALDRQPGPKVYANLTLPTPPRPYSTFQPKMPPPARHLYVADVRTLAHEQRVLLVCLQGIVNRKQPRIYLIEGEDDPFWLDQMQKQGDTDAPIKVANPMSLVQTFRSSIKGAVVPDPKVYVSPNIAADFAGLEDLVIATPQLAAQLKLPIARDLRGMWKDDAAALRYARTKLLPRMNPYLAICLDPPLLDSGAMDQIIAAKGMAFWITGPKQQKEPGAGTAAELDEIEQTFAAMPLNATIRGFWWHGDNVGLAEDAGVSLGSRFGKVTLVSDYVHNFSVLSGVPQASLQQKFAPPPKLDPTKVYVALTMSDGDNLSTWPGYFRGYFNDPLHGTFPIGWGMGPSIIECAPTWARWYYNHATRNDEFLCDVSGAAYIYPPDWGTALRDRDGALRSFYDLTAKFMGRMDMKTIRLMNVRTEDIPRVGAMLPSVSFLMPDYGHAGAEKYDELTYTLPTGQPVFRATTNGEGAQNLADQVRRRAGTQRPAFVNAFIWNWGSKLKDLKQMLDILGPEYVVVTPSQLNALYREANGLVTR